MVRRSFLRSIKKLSSSYDRKDSEALIRIPQENDIVPRTKNNDKPTNDTTTKTRNDTVDRTRIDKDDNGSEDQKDANYGKDKTLDLRICGTYYV